MKKIKYACILVLILFGIKEAAAQFPLFEKNARVCFIGNSITMNGRFHNYIELYYTTRFPEREVKFFNCGISGDVAGGILRRMNSDVLVHQPTWSVLMVGMNDVNRGLYAKERVNEPGIKEKQQEALNRYFTNVDSIVKILLRANSKVVLQTPSIYDQTADMATPNLFGVNDALQQCAKYLKELGSKYNLPVVDYWTVMSDINGKIQKSDIHATIVGKDRVHPDVTGHFLMAYEFLRTQQVPEYVSHINIDAGKHQVNKTIQVTINDMSYRNDDVAFSAYETSLPYPRLSKDFNPDSLFSFTCDLNRQILQVSALKKGTYQLVIDSVVAGSFSHTDLNAGVNLAGNVLTPQYRQAEQVLKRLNQLWEIKTKLRQVKYVEHGLMGGELTGPKSTGELKDLFEKRLERFKDQPQSYIDFYKKHFNEYFINKPMEEELLVKADQAFDEIQQINKPVKHYFQVKRIN